MIHEKLPEYTTESLNFKECLHVLKEHAKSLFSASDEERICKELESARSVRNHNSHQNFGMVDFQHHFECLEKLSMSVGLQKDALQVSLDFSLPSMTGKSSRTKATSSTRRPSGREP